jgi:hypothetical protein
VGGRRTSLNACSSKRYAACEGILALAFRALEQPSRMRRALQCDSLPLVPRRIVADAVKRTSIKAGEPVFSRDTVDARSLPTIATKKGS